MGTAGGGSCFLCVKIVWDWEGEIASSIVEKSRKNGKNKLQLF